jgi:hypothetical protein
MGGLSRKDQRDVFSAAMPAHTDLYYRSFKNRAQENLRDKSSLMQIDVLGKFLSGSDDVLDNFSLNFSSVAPFWETAFNKDVKIDYRTVPIKGIAEEMSKNLRESLLRQEAE